RFHRYLDPQSPRLLRDFSRRRASSSSDSHSKGENGGGQQRRVVCRALLAESRTPRWFGCYSDADQLVLSHCLSRHWFRSHVVGVSACGSSTLWRFEVAVLMVRRPSHVVARCCSWQHLSACLPYLMEVWDGGACVVRLWSHVVAPVRAEGCFRIVSDFAGFVGVVFGPTLVVGRGVTLFRCFVFLLLWLVRDWLSLLSLVCKADLLLSSGRDLLSQEFIVGRLWWRFVTPCVASSVASFPAGFECELQESVAAAAHGHPEPVAGKQRSGRCVLLLAASGGGLVALIVTMFLSLPAALAGRDSLSQKFVAGQLWWRFVTPCVANSVRCECVSSCTGVS
ncbi:hypothetical protein Taro_027539, partial [Colocasia esculenta]|nr:hypothetical protein [Colocasia esculenta]